MAAAKSRKGGWRRWYASPWQPPAKPARRPGRSAYEWAGRGPGAGPAPEDERRGSAHRAEVPSQQGKSGKRADQDAGLIEHVEGGESLDPAFLARIGRQVCAYGRMKRAPANPVRAEATISAGSVSATASSPKATVRRVQPARIIGLQPYRSARVPR